MALAWMAVAAGENETREPRSGLNNALRLE
jgi:hypothetical protein